MPRFIVPSGHLFYLFFLIRRCRRSTACVLHDRGSSSPLFPHTRVVSLSLPAAKLIGSNSESYRDLPPAATLTRPVLFLLNPFLHFYFVQNLLLPFPSANSIAPICPLNTPFSPLNCFLHTLSAGNARNRTLQSVAQRPFVISATLLGPRFTICQRRATSNSTASATPF